MNIRPLHDRVVVRRLEEETTSAGGIVLPDSLVALLVVDPTLVRVAEHFVSVRDFLELCLRSLWVVLVLVRMVLDGQLLELLLDLRLGRVLLKPHDLVDCCSRDSGVRLQDRKAGWIRLQKTDDKNPVDTISKHVLYQGQRSRTVGHAISLHTGVMQHAQM